MNYEKKAAENMEKCLKKHRYLLEIQYLGTKYKGWQKQKNYPNQTIQEILENKLGILLKHNINLYAAGRTDSKVSARQQFAHFDTYFSIERIKFLYSLNSLLKNETICVKNIIVVDQNFHSRFSCVQKTYRYYLLFEKTQDIFSNTYWHLPNMINSANINEEQFLNLANNCAKYLIGTHDFASFQDSNCQAKNSIRTINECAFFQEKTQFSLKYFMEISSRSFLQHQIRIIIGTIIEIIKNKEKEEKMKYILEQKNRQYAGITAPAQGLFLDNIIY